MQKSENSQHAFPFVPSTSTPDNTRKPDVGETKSIAPAGHNLTARAKDLTLLAPQHERRHLDQRIIDTQSLRASNPNLIRPFPVLDTTTGLRLVDGSTLIAAICDADPERLVPVEIVSEEEAYRIRSQDNATRAPREPMAQSRRALILRQSGMTNGEIAIELCIGKTDKALSDARVTQLCDAAMAEEAHSKLAEMIVDPANVPASFWERIAKTTKARADKNAAAPVKTGPSLSEQFQTAISTLIEAGRSMTHEEIAAALRLNEGRKVKTRARKFGKPIDIEGTGEKLHVERKRKGGAVLNLPAKLSAHEVDIIVEAVLAKTSEVIRAKQTSAKK